MCFDADRLDEFYYANHQRQSTETTNKLLFDNLRRISARNIYSVPKSYLTSLTPGIQTSVFSWRNAFLLKVCLFYIKTPLKNSNS